MCDLRHGADYQGEIRATGFNEAVDQYYEMMQEGKVGRAAIKTS